jgi:hypothetical protein
MSLATRADSRVPVPAPAPGPSAAERFGQFLRQNVHRGPDWRYQRARSLTDTYPQVKRCSRHDDPYVRALRIFLLRRAATADAGALHRLWGENPGLYSAHNVFEGSTEEPARRMYVEARLLSGQTVEDIVAVQDIAPETVAWYAAVYFDVGDRLEKRDWIMEQVLVPSLLQGRQVASVESFGVPSSAVAQPVLDSTLKYFAYYGGPHLADFMIAQAEIGQTLYSREQVPQWVDRFWSSSIRRRSLQAAQTFEITKYNVTELFAVHTKIMEIERSEENQEKQRSVYEMHVKGMLENVPFSIHSPGRLKQGGPLAAFDARHVELRDAELAQVAAGQADPLLSDQLDDIILPPPRAAKTKLQALEGPADLEEKL